MSVQDVCLGQIGRASLNYAKCIFSNMILRDQDDPPSERAFIQHKDTRHGELLSKVEKLHFRFSDWSEGHWPIRI